MNSEQIKNWIDEVLWDETGLHLEEGFPFAIEENPREVKLQLGDLTCQVARADEDGGEVNLQEAIGELAGEIALDLKGEILRWKMELLEESLLEWAREKIWSGLKKGGLSEDQLEDLLLEIKDWGYFPSHHGMVEEEYVRGLPGLGMELSDLSSGDFEPVGVVFENPSGEKEDTEEAVELLIERFLDEWRKKDDS